MRPGKSEVRKVNIQENNEIVRQLKYLTEMVCFLKRAVILYGFLLGIIMTVLIKFLTNQ